MSDIRHRIGIDAPQAQVHHALATHDGLATWWTTDVDGDAGEGGKVAFYFGGERRGCRHGRGAGHRRPGGVALRGGPRRVARHHLHLRARPRRRRDVVLFTNAGWREPVAFQAHCTTKWGYFLLGLKAAARGRRGHALSRMTARSAGGVDARTRARPRRRLPGPGRPQPAHAARQPPGPQRPEPARAVRRAGHGPPVGEQAPVDPRGRRPGDHRAPRPGEVALPQRRPDQRDRRSVDQPLRPRPGRSPGRPQESTRGAHDVDLPQVQAHVRLHHLHPHHPRAAVEGPDRPGLHLAATGTSPSRPTGSPARPWCGTTTEPASRTPSRWCSSPTPSPTCPTRGTP